jgi:hypothetical protein
LGARSKQAVQNCPRAVHITALGTRIRQGLGSTTTVVDRVLGTAVDILQKRRFKPLYGCAWRDRGLSGILNLRTAGGGQRVDRKA